MPRAPVRGKEREIRRAARALIREGCNEIVVIYGREDDYAVRGRIGELSSGSSQLGENEWDELVHGKPAA